MGKSKSMILVGKVILRFGMWFAVLTEKYDYALSVEKWFYIFGRKNDFAVMTKNIICDFDKKKIILRV